MNKLFLIFFVAFYAVNVLSSPPNLHLMNKRDRFCGDKLKNALKLLCAGVYNSPSKKLGADFTFNSYADFSDETDSGEDLEVSTPQKRERRRGQIVEECCHRSCSFSTLSMYCG